MSSHIARRRGSAGRRRWAAGALVVPLLMIGACSRSGTDAVQTGAGNVQVEGTGGGSGGGGGKPGAPAVAAGDFGTLKGLCGPGDGKPLNNPPRGVTEKEIAVSTMGDPGNPMQPGLGQEFFDMADAFTKWCNNAGGVNGRKIKLNKRDGQLFNAPTTMTEACQTDFMAVGGGNPLDAGTVEPRLGCKLGAIPGYVVSTQAITAPLQIQPGGIPADEGLVGAYKALFEKYPEAKDKVGIVGMDMPDTKVVADRYADAVRKAGGTVVDTQLAEALGALWRPRIEAMKAADVQIVVGAGVFAIDANSFFQEANNVGWAPKAIVTDQSAYNNFTIDSAKQTETPEFYVYSTFIPQEMADKNPAAKQAVDLLRSVKKDARMVYFHYSGLHAWLVWASAVKDCGSDVTVDCVMEKSKRPGWDAGGLFAPNDIGPLDQMRMNSCFAMLKLGKEGFAFDAETTKPNTNEIFNCSPDNVAKLDKVYS